MYDIHHPFSSLRADVLQRYKRGVFIETGSNTGEAIAVALACGFQNVHSIEIEGEFLIHCVRRFLGDNRVFLYHGSSPVWLERILPEINEPAVIYLDAHSIEVNPLLEELDAIRRCGRDDHVILIDDVRMFGTPDWHGISQAQALEIIFQINPHYTISYANTNHAASDLLVAEP